MDYISREAVMDALLNEQYGYLCEDAIRAIPAADVREASRWISVKERLPKPYSWVLGFGFGETELPIDVFYNGSEWKDSVLGGWYITHWMPLPTPPKEEQT